VTIETSEVAGVLSDQIFYFKEDRQITHNSMFADLAFTHLELAQKRLAATASASAANPRPNCQRTTFSLPYKAKPDLRQ
jgi:hypothetical protein